jgi:hypothetical protein
MVSSTPVLCAGREAEHSIDTLVLLSQHCRLT